LCAERGKKRELSMQSRLRGRGKPQPSSLEGEKKELLKALSSSQRNGRKKKKGGKEGGLALVNPP